MSESKVSRTLLKSPPELWSEVSNAASLQRHLTQFGDIRITKLESESAVAWEGERARGTIRLEPSGWGTRVSLTAQPARAASNGPAGSNAPTGSRGPAAFHGPTAEEPGADVDSAEAHGAGKVEQEESGQLNELSALSERGPRETAERKRRWPTRLAETVRRWFSPGPPAVEPEAEAVPEPPAAVPGPVPPRAAHTPTTAPANTQPPQTERAPAATVALNEALDSLGRAHHRPFSRA